MALSSATPLPGALASSTPPASATANTSAPTGAAVAVHEVDELDVEAQVERVEPLRRSPAWRTSPSATSRSSAPTRTRPARSASGRCSNHAELSGPLESRAAVPSVAAAEDRRAQQRHRGRRVEQAGRAGQVGHDGVQQVADRQGVARARGVADVVLEHPPAAELVADQVEAHHRRADASAGQPARPPRASPGEPDDQVGLEQAVAQDALLAVDVAQERLDRPGALDEPAAQVGPLVRRDDPGHQVDA